MHKTEEEISKHYSLPHQRTLRIIYYDEEGNTRFQNEFLEDQESYNTFYEEEEFKAPVMSSQQKSLQSVTKDAVIDHFDGAKPNPRKWISEFEKECNRLQIAEINRCI